MNPDSSGPRNRPLRGSPRCGGGRIAGAVLLAALVSSGCTAGHSTSAGGHGSSSVTPAAALAPSTTAAANPAADAAARQACASATAVPKTLADVASNYARSSINASQAARLDKRWEPLARATSALANSWQALRGYPTKPGHPLALNSKAMTPYQKQEYHRRYTIATDVYPTILIQCRKATG